jgi:hypothetical protein
MTRLDSIDDGLDLLVPRFDEPPDWEDVLERADVSSPERTRAHVFPRRLQLAAATVLALAAVVGLGVSPAGGTLVRSVSDFSSWLTGDPGDSASRSEQGAFEEAYGSSLASVPDRPELRRLIATTTEDGGFELFGFRTGDSLCLFLTISGIRSDGPVTSCAPLDELGRAKRPVVPLLVDYPVGQQAIPPDADGYIPPRAQVTFGVVANGVVDVVVRASGADHTAVVLNNAFLAVISNPRLGAYSQQLVSVDREGRRSDIPIARARTAVGGRATETGVAPGPSAIERPVQGGAISWLEDRESRGISLEEAGIDEGALAGSGAFNRVVSPEPNGQHRVVLSIGGPSARQRVCDSVLTAAGAVGGCSRLAHYFEDAPFSVGVIGSQGGDQYILLHGLASDDVARLEIYLTGGERIAVPLQDNAYVIAVARTKFPARLVAFDHDGRTIGNRAFSHDPLENSTASGTG